MKRSEKTVQNDIDISSLSPPSVSFDFVLLGKQLLILLFYQVQFVIGTPPGSGRRRSASSSLCETPPPPNVWSVSPVSVHRQYQSNSPLRRSGKKLGF